ncbi:sigma-70 family RNA polymerase sigma factor [Leucothrix arctica]|uniref:sigma-70 family RNA polymerase sigma factor n=1 Tax=Leucothrix arctica TaxID=1481894 RepID=UPI001FEC8F63|nr:sigma-70 family RNA polymerase sigma factor [Leucothrix arctica]
MLKENKNNPKTDDRTEDTELLKLIDAGDRNAFSTLYLKYQPRFLKYCTRVLKNDVALAADIVDEAMIEIWKSAGNFAGKSLPSTWMYSIMRFRLIGYLRKNKEILLEDDTAAINMEDTALRPDEELELSQTNSSLVKQLGQLSDKHREVLELVYFKELSVKEVALTLDISEGTVKTRMFYARKHLKEILTQKGNL